ncbi:hypothetical protein SFRURICE_012900 [Spodoptera frugiperda]|nr:hypothetical protein SFRURICE_012900 [Spodoptera frugiperda]
MTEEKDICNDNERITVGGEKETETSVQVQKQSEIERESESQLRPSLEKRNSVFEKYAPTLNSNSFVRKLNSGNTAQKTASLPFRLVEKSSVLKVGGVCGINPSSMSRGCTRLSGIWSVVGVVVLLVARVGGSEFPERECCDPVYPPNTATTAAAPITPPIPKLTG